ncbi:MAG: hypothetical protein ACKOXX_06575 [Actinomycetota bacterium]
MPSIKINNPLQSLDLTSVDVRKTAAELRKVVSPVAKIARDAAYVSVGVGVIATQRVNARRYDARQRISEVQQRISDVAPRVRDEAKATAERVIDEASEKVRGLVERRKRSAAASTNTVA